jgi:signal transduction histidine kinase
MEFIAALIPKILVVNDNPASLLGMTAMLEQWTEELGYEIVTARSGEETLRQVLTHEFAVILLDVNMPGMDGFETAEAIHSRTSSASIPIIFVTAYLADEIHRLKGYQMGAADYLFTPIVPQILKAKLSVFVALARKNHELKAQTQALNERTRELTEINTDLARAINERKFAEKQNQAKDEFLAMLGHELRNPLSAISTAAQLISEPLSQSGGATQAHEVIQRQSKHLARIVDDLLDMSRVMAGKIQLCRQAVDLCRFTQNCLNTLRLSGRAESHIIDFDGEEAWIDADLTRLEQMVVNLLDNALKYTPPGGMLTIRVEAQDNEAVLRVQDSGLGISAELLPHVFDVFVQGEQALDRAQGGLGIGLSLVRKLAQLHGGAVDAASPGSDQGSVFTIRFPLVEPAPRHQPNGPTAMDEIGPCTILLIDDHDDGRMMMGMMLNAYGNEILEAANGTHGLALADSRQPDIALVDIGLPGIDGYEVARRLRANPATSGIRLIALTGYGSAADTQRAIDAGFDLHLVKPVDSERLLAAIHSCISASRIAETAVAR